MGNEEVDEFLVTFFLGPFRRKNAELLNPLTRIMIPYWKIYLFTTRGDIDLDALDDIHILKNKITRSKYDRTINPSRGRTPISFSPTRQEISYDMQYLYDDDLFKPPPGDLLFGRLSMYMKFSVDRARPVDSDYEIRHSKSLEDAGIKVTLKKFVLSHSNSNGHKAHLPDELFENIDLSQLDYLSFTAVVISDEVRSGISAKKFYLI